MGLQQSWQEAHETRRRRIVRQKSVSKKLSRDEKAQRRAKLRLVASNTIPTVVPADYLSAHGVAIPPRTRWEYIVAAIAAVGVHLGAVWILAHLPPSQIISPPKPNPVEVAFVTPTPPPPPKVEPPPPPKVQQKVVKTTVPVVQKVVQQDVVATENVVAVQEGPPPTPPAPVEEKITAPRADANYLNNPAPDYPPVALRQGWKGTVQIRVLVQPDGHPATITVEKSSGKKVLDDAALVAVQKWKFAPAKRGDTPVEGWVSFPIEFNIDS